MRVESQEVGFLACSQKKKSFSIKEKKMKRLILTTCLCLLFAAGTALADWNLGDPNKWVQLPNMSGQDIEPLLADDWLCTQSGPVTDVHFWTLNVGYPFPSPVPPIYMTISSNNPNYENMEYSAPYLQLWDRYFQPGEYTVRDWDYNHWQFNITDINDPFIQTEGQTYWLGLRIQLGNNPHLSWNYTDNGHQDHAVYWISPSWFPLSGDLAFVITPEPATIGILGLGCLLLGRNRKFNKKQK
jgi:hypothetical protein